MNILVTGASGFIGKHLLTLCKQQEIDVIALTRDKSQFAGKDIKAIESLAEIADDDILEAIINLAGARIDKRWSARYKDTLLASRCDTTKALYSLVERLQVKPKTLLSASAVGYYGDQNDATINETSPPRQEFTHELCNLWEQEALKISTFGTRVAIMRFGVVLDKKSAMLRKVLPPFYMGLGGIIGSGDQYMSWIHIDDVMHAILFLLNTQNSHIIYNVTSPFPVTNKEWTKALSRALHRPAFFPMPSAVVRLLFGEMGHRLLLCGQRAIPQNLKQEGFEFKYPTINEALAEIIG